MQHGCTDTGSPSPQGPSPRSGRCPLPSSPSAAWSPPSVWVLFLNGWAGETTQVKLSLF